MTYCLITNRIAFHRPTFDSIETLFIRQKNGNMVHTLCGLVQWLVHGSLSLERIYGVAYDTTRIWHFWKMDSMVFVVLLFVTTFNTIKTVTLDVTSDVVTVREGEQLNLACSITLDGQGIAEVRWYRDTNQTLYGSIDVTNCGIFPLCPVVNTTDNRGVVQYTRGFQNDDTLTLVIDHSLVRDNTSFYCGVITQTNNFQSSDNIYVIVQHLPDPTYPMCLRSNSSTLTDVLSLSCWAEKTLPVVSLEWTVEGISSDQISFFNTTEINEYRVENNLFLKETRVSSGSFVFTCHMTSSAFPHTRRNCSIGPILTTGDQTTEGILSDATTTTTLFAQDGTPTTPTADNITTRSDPPLNTIVIASIASGSVVIIVILLIIIACLVSSRRKRSRAAKKDPKDLSIRLSVAITSPGSNTNLFHEAHVYANQSDPAISSNNRPGRFELPLPDKTASPPSPLYAAVSSVKNFPHVQVGDNSYAMVSKRDKRRGGTPLEDQPNMGYGSQHPPEYHTLDEPDDRQLTQGQVSKSTEGQVEYDVPRPGQGLRSQGSSQLDEDEGKLIDNILYTTTGNEYN